MKTRIRFTKTGSVKFIGHLDLMRFFQKAIRRAKLDVAYSKGYSPHQLMSFASPLGVGVTSDGEYIDVEFHSLPDMEKEELISYMNRFMTDEVFVTDIKVLPEHAKTSMALLRAADYMISFLKDDTWGNSFLEQFSIYAERPEIPILKKTKRSEAVVDVKENLICYDFSLDRFCEKTGTVYPELHNEYTVKNTLFLQLTSGSTNNIKPGIIVDDFLKYLRISAEPYSYQIHRLEMYFNLVNKSLSLVEA